jgi:hypothetical protein
MFVIDVANSKEHIVMCGLMTVIGCTFGRLEFEKSACPKW